MAASLGPKGAKKHVKTAVVPLIGVMADAKVQLREKAAAALSSWLELVPMKLWFDDEAISATPPRQESPSQSHFPPMARRETQGTEKVPKAGLEPCLKHTHSDGRPRWESPCRCLGRPPCLMIIRATPKWRKRHPQRNRKSETSWTKSKRPFPSGRAPVASDRRRARHRRREQKE